MITGFSGEKLGFMKQTLDSSADGDPTMQRNILAGFSNDKVVVIQRRNRAVTPSMRLYLLRVEARLRGITALKAMSQVRQSSQHPM